MFAPLENTIKEVMYLTWPMIVIAGITVSSIRVCYLARNKDEFVLYKELMMLCFLIYIMCLFQVVTFQDAPSLGGGSNLIPFSEIFRYQLGSRLFLKQVVGNLLMFIPYGFFVSYYMNSKKITIPFFLVLLASVSIETTQLAIGRVFDIDDIILNVLGGVLGYLIYHILDKIHDFLPNFLKSNWFLNLMMVLVIILFICLISRVVVV